MNENESVSPPANPPALDDPESAAAGEEPRENDAQELPENCSDEVAAPAGGSLESDPPVDLPDPSEPQQLREELNRLREEIRSTREALLRREAEFAEFRSLYPDLPLSALPDSVWEDVSRGIPLSAAVALSERRRELTQKQAEEANRKNRHREGGEIGNPTSGYFSAREVRAMTPKEVRENYKKIMLSMPKWQ